MAPSIQTATAQQTAVKAPRPLGRVYVHGQRWYLTFSKAGFRKTVNLGGTAELGEAQARKLADEVMHTGLRDKASVANKKRKLDPTPTFTDFVRDRFIPEYVERGKLSHGGKEHYRAIFKYTLPIIGDKRICDIRYGDLQELIDYKREQGYGWQTLRHIRNTLSAVFKHAVERTYHHPGPNPAKALILPKREQRQPRTAASAETCRKLLAIMPPQVALMCEIAICCGTGPAEVTAIRWGRTNLTAEPQVSDDQVLPPFSVRICEDLYKGHFGPTKCLSRVRILPLPHRLVEKLSALRASTPYNKANDLVICTCTGHFVSIDGVMNRIYRPTARAHGIATKFYELRHTHATLIQQQGMAYIDAQAQMGHLSGMTMHYTHPDVERRRGIVEKLSELIHS